jgi:hypothetical protein
VADSPDQKIPQKMYHAKIQNDHQAIAKEETGYKPLPIIQMVTEQDVKENYLKVKREVQQLMALELKKIKDQLPVKKKKEGKKANYGVHCRVKSR